MKQLIVLIYFCFQLVFFLDAQSIKYDLMIDDFYHADPGKLTSRNYIVLSYDNRELFCNEYDLNSIQYILDSIDLNTWCKYYIYLTQDDNIIIHSFCTNDHHSRPKWTNLYSVNQNHQIKSLFKGDANDSVTSTHLSDIDKYGNTYLIIQINEKDSLQSFLRKINPNGEVIYDIVLPINYHKWDLCIKVSDDQRFIGILPFIRGTCYIVDTKTNIIYKMIPSFLDFEFLPNEKILVVNNSSWKILEFTKNVEELFSGELKGLIRGHENITVNFIDQTAIINSSSEDGLMIIQMLDITTGQELFWEKTSFPYERPNKTYLRKISLDSKGNYIIDTSRELVKLIIK